MIYYIVSTYSGYHLHVLTRNTGEDEWLTTYRFREQPAPYHLEEATKILEQYNRLSKASSIVILNQEQLDHFICELDQELIKQ